MPPLLRRLAAPAAFAAGLLWLLHVTLFIAYGVARGRLLVETPTAPLYRLDFAVFMATYSALGLALLGLSARLFAAAPRRSRLGGLLGAAPVVVGLLGLGVALIAPGLLPQAGQRLGAPGILTAFLSALMLGSTALHTRALPRRAGGLLVGFALLTVPLALAFPLLEGPLPLYALYDTHFALVGIAWIVLSRALRGPTSTYGAVSAVPAPAP